MHWIVLAIDASLPFSCGRCIPKDERFDTERHFTCVCALQWFGDRCEKAKFSINLLLTNGIKVSAASIAFFYMLIIRTYRESLRMTSFNRLRQDISNITLLFEYTVDADDFDGLAAFL